MTLREKIKIFRIKFKELKKREKALFIIFVLAFIGVFVWWVNHCIYTYRLIKNTERWVLVSLGILGLYELTLLYHFTKRMSTKEKELNGIMRKQMSFKDTKEALHNYDFVTAPEIIFGEFLEKSSIIIALFVNYVLSFLPDAEAQNTFDIYSFCFITCVCFGGLYKIVYILLTNTCVIFMDISFCRNRKIHSLLKEALNSKFR